MLRLLGCTLAAAIFAGGLLLPDDKDKGKDTKGATPATISKVDPGKNNITLKYKDKDGKEVEKMFDLKGDVKMYDKTGKVVAVDYYKLGGGVLVVEREGRILELREDDKKGKDKDK